MGQALTRLILDDATLTLVGGLEAAGASTLGGDMAELAGRPACGVLVGDTSAPGTLKLVAEADAIVDFTTPEASLALADLAAQARIVHVIGSTGFSPKEDEKLAAAARHATIIKSGNMSLGVNLLAGLAKQAAATLGDDWDIEILDIHHRHKLDAPSGTALLLGEAAATGRGVVLDDKKISGRDGIGTARTPGEIGFAALRGGSVIGEHEVIFAANGEQIRLGHRAETRDIFARGALQAVRWGQGRAPGLYTMQHVLGFDTRN